MCCGYRVTVVNKTSVPHISVTLYSQDGSRADTYRTKSVGASVRLYMRRRAGVLTFGQLARGYIIQGKALEHISLEPNQPAAAGTSSANSQQQATVVDTSAVAKNAAAVKTVFGIHVTSGDNLTIVDDPEFPPFNQDQAHAAHHFVVGNLETLPRRLKLLSSSSSSSSSEATESLLSSTKQQQQQQDPSFSVVEWDKLAAELGHINNNDNDNEKQLGHNIATSPETSSSLSPESIQELHAGNGWQLASWKETYHPVTVVKGVPRHILENAFDVQGTPGNNINNNNSNSKNNNKWPMKIEAYWRAFDESKRDLDMFTVKYTLSDLVEMPKNGGVPPQFTSTVYSIQRLYKGTTRMLAGPSQPSHLFVTDKLDNVVRAVKAFVREQMDISSSSSIASDTDTGTKNATTTTTKSTTTTSNSTSNLDVTFHEPVLNFSNRELGSLWTSQEILIYLPIPWTLSTRNLFSETDKRQHDILRLMNMRMPAGLRLPLEIITRIMQFTVTKYNNGMDVRQGALVARLHLESVMLMDPDHDVKNDASLKEVSGLGKEVFDAVEGFVQVGTPARFGGDIDDDEDGYEGEEQMEEYSSKAGRAWRQCDQVMHLDSSVGDILPAYLQDS